MKTITLKSGKEISLNQAFNMDCLDFMKELPDKCIDLVLTDPPYGINIAKEKPRKSGRWNYEPKKWDNAIPSDEIFNEIFRISKNQIIWGGNYFKMNPSRCWLIWNKKQPVDNFSDAELAWTSFDKVVSMYDFAVMGNRDKIHISQKPMKLFKWCLNNYAEEGMIVFDPFLGSFTTAIASENCNMNWLGCEKDPDYFKSGYHRYEQETKQLLMEF
jgi:site-specific DNA-methyltransferase (adenine-specific)